MAECRKKEQLKVRVFEFIDTVIEFADKEGRLDYLNIEISNHQGTLQMDYTFRDRQRAY